MRCRVCFNAGVQYGASMGRISGLGDMHIYSSVVVVFIPESEMMPWGRYCARFADLDGNLFFVSDAT